MQPTTSVSTTRPPNFVSTEIHSITFLENNEHLLLLEESHDTVPFFRAPGSRCQTNESPKICALRSLSEQTRIPLSLDKVVLRGTLYVQTNGSGREIHIFKSVLQSRPPTADSCQWISLFAFEILNKMNTSPHHSDVATLLEEQRIAFRACYQERMWLKVKEDPNHPNVLVLRKGETNLIFNSQRKLVINLIGGPGSGKGNQGELLRHLLDLPRIADSEIIGDEHVNRTALSQAINLYPQQLPDEIPYGILAKRLSEEDCKRGFICDGFPRKHTQCPPLLEIFSRTADVFIPLFLEVSEEDIRERYKSSCLKCRGEVIPLSAQTVKGKCPVHQIDLVNSDETLDSRLMEFNTNKEAILREIERRSPLLRFSVTNAMNPLEVFHQVAKQLQIRLDELAKKEEADKRSPKDNTKASTQTKKNFLPNNFLVTTTLVALVFGGIFVVRSIMSRR